MGSTVCKNVDVAKFLTADKSKSQEWKTQEWRCSNILVEIVEEGLHADVTFEAEGGSVKAHRNVLASVSPVFAEMFCHDMKEQLISTKQISNMTIDVLRLFLLVLYTTNNACDPGVPELNGAIDKNFKGFHQAMMKYQVERRLESVLMLALIRNLNSDNCWVYYIEFLASQMYDEVYVYRQYILSNYAELIKSKRFLVALKSNPTEVCAVIRDAKDQAGHKLDTLAKNTWDTLS